MKETESKKDKSFIKQKRNVSGDFLKRIWEKITNNEDRQEIQHTDSRNTWRLNWSRIKKIVKLK